MKFSKKTICVLPSLAIFASSLFCEVSAQRLYDGERDKQAQDAVKLAEEIITKSTFEAQLRNLDRFATRDFEVFFRGAKRQTEFDIAAFSNWEDINNHVDMIKGVLNAGNSITDEETAKIVADLESRCATPPTTGLGTQICQTKAEVAKMEAEIAKSEIKGQALEEELNTRLEAIDLFEALLQKATTYFKDDEAAKTAQTANEFAGAFFNMARSYANFTNKIQAIRNQPLNEVRLLLYRVAIDSLQVEADHWKTVAAIKLRRVGEQEDISRLVADYELRLQRIAECLGVTPGSFAKEKIHTTFGRVKALQTCEIPESDNPDVKEKLSTEELLAYFQAAMYSVSALVARGETPYKLAELRLAQEEHRFSIRQSAVVARGYELVLRSGTKRLGRYHAGGLKPEKIAQLIYSAATVAIPGVIAGK